MLKTTVGYRTMSSGNTLSLDIFGGVYHRDRIPLFYPKEDLILLCHNKHTCGGFSGGCPGFAPYFDDIKPSCDWFYLIVVRMDIAWAIQYAGGNEYFRFSYADRLTASYMARITRELSQLRKAFRLVVGGCNACSMRKKCVVLEGEPCANPSLRTYSVEAVGVDCSEAHRMLFGHRLPYWYYDGVLPQYMVRYGGLFLKDPDGIDSDLLMTAKLDKSYIPHEPQHIPYRLVKRVAPDHVTADPGLEYIGYEMLEDGSYATE